MGWFKVSAAWAEKDPSTGYTRWMFRFEYFKYKELGWWAPPGESHQPLITMEELKACCLICKEPYPQVFEIGWLCLNPKCTEFWKVRHLFHYRKGFTDKCSIMARSLQRV